MALGITMDVEQIEDYMNIKVDLFKRDRNTFESQILSTHTCNDDDMEKNFFAMSEDMR